MDNAKNINNYGAGFIGTNIKKYLLKMKTASSMWSIIFQEIHQINISLEKIMKQ